MPAATKKQSPRYSYTEIAVRIEQMKAERGVSTKELCAKVGLTQSQWSRKVRGLGNTFTLAEFGAIADAFNAPEGWPFVERAP